MTSMYFTSSLQQTFGIIVRLQPVNVLIGIKPKYVAALYDGKVICSKNDYVWRRLPLNCQSLWLQLESYVKEN